MSKYSSKTFSVQRSAAEIADKFSDLTALQPTLDKLPEEQRAQLGSIELQPDSVIVKTPQIGDIRFRVVERTPQYVQMKAEGTPVPLSLKVDLDQKAPDLTDATCSVDVDIPIFLRPMIGPQMQKAVDMLAELMHKVMA